ncbi:Sodium- and chloride-dependent glycine transporter 1, partial [Bulinus truncatus]
AVLITTLSTYQPPVYEGYVYGPGAVIFGWFIASVSFLPIPIYAAYRLMVTQGTLIQRLKVSCTPTAEWRPQDETLNKSYQKLAAQRTICAFRLPRFRRKH